MINITEDNFMEVSVARDYFLGMVYRLLREGQLIHCQFSFYPASFNWLDYLQTSIDPNLVEEMDVEFLQMGAALTAVNWIEDSYSQECFGDKYSDVVMRLKESNYGKRNEFRRFLEAISKENNLGDVEASMREIFLVYVSMWWINQAAELPKNPHL